MKKIIMAAMLILTGCAMTLPAKGIVQDSDEVLSGTATGYLDGAGTLNVTSNKGTHCIGNFVYVNSRQGDGTIQCDDGRTGSFRFSSTGRKGTGVGELSGKKVTFTFGF